MIVICTGCQARFRVADDKIGPRGAKVRCTRCQNVFVVKRDAAEAPPAPKFDLDLTPGLGRPPAAADPFAQPPAGASVISFPPGAPSLAGGAAVDPFAAAGLDVFAAEGSAGDDPFARAAVGVGVAAPTAPRPAIPPAALEGDPFAGGTGSQRLPVTDLSQLLGGPAQAAAPPLAAPPAPPPAAPRAPSPFAADLALEEHSGPLAGLSPASSAPFADPADVVQADPGLFPSGGDFEPGPAMRGEESLSLATEKTPPPMLAPPPGAIDSVADLASSLLDGDDSWPGPSQGGPGAAPAPAPPVIPVAEEPGAPPAAALAAAPPRPAEPATHRVRSAALNALALVALAVLALAIRAVLRGDVPLGPAAFRPSTLLQSFARGPAPTGPFELAEVKSGVYPQGSGGTVLFVRGVVICRPPAPLDGVRVEAELVRDGRVLAHGAVRAGAVPSPEEVYRATDRAALDALGADLGQRAPKQVRPGDRLGFLITLGDAPADLSGASVRLQAAPEAGAAH